MKNNRLAFKVLEEDDKVPIGYKWMKCHMVFDIKMEFTRKARYVAGGHMTDPPATLTYSSVVSRDSVRIAFLLAALNDIDILACDIGNAYLNASPREKVYTTAGPKFGAENTRETCTYSQGTLWPQVKRGGMAITPSQHTSSNGLHFEPSRSRRLVQSCKERKRV
jgi:hypothetical protein